MVSDVLRRALLGACKERERSQNRSPEYAWRAGFPPRVREAWNEPGLDVVVAPVVAAG